LHPRFAACVLIGFFLVLFSSAVFATNITVQAKFVNSTTNAPIAGVAVQYIAGAYTYPGGSTGSDGKAGLVTLQNGQTFKVKGEKAGYNTVTSSNFTVPNSSPYNVTVSMTPSAPTCTNECSSGQTGCLNSTIQWACGYIPNDGDPACLDKIISTCTTGQSCSSNTGQCTSTAPACTDSDSTETGYQSNERYTAGNVISSAGTSKDSCASSTRITERYCSTSTQSAYNTYDCGTGYECKLSSNNEAYCTQTIPTTFAVQVKNNQTNTGIANATVKVVNTSNSLTLTHVTNNNGIATFTDEVNPNQTYRVTVTATGFNNPPDQTITIVGGAANQLNFSLTPSSSSSTTTATFTVRNTAGSGISGATVTISKSGLPDMIKTTNSSGDATATLTIGQTYTVTATKAGHTTHSLTATVSANQHNYMTINPTVTNISVKACVTNSGTGTALSGVSTTYIVGSTNVSGGTTDSSGCANAMTRQPGEVINVRLEKSGFDTVTSSNYTIPSTSPYTISLTMTPTSSSSNISVNARVVDFGGAPIQGTVVTYIVGSTTRAGGTTNITGWALPITLRAGDSFKVKAEKAGYATVTSTSYTVPNSSPYQVTVAMAQSAGMTTLTVLVARDDPDRFQRIIKIQGASVQVSADGETAQTKTTNSEGEAIFTATIGKSYRIAASKPGFRNASTSYTVTATGPNQPVVLMDITCGNLVCESETHEDASVCPADCASLVAIKANVRGKQSGSAVPGARFEVRKHPYGNADIVGYQATDTSGNASVLVPPDRTYRVHAEGDDIWARVRENEAYIDRTINVGRVSPDRLNFDLDEHVLEFTVKDEAGRPRSGATIKLDTSGAGYSDIVAEKTTNSGGEAKFWLSPVRFYYPEIQKDGYYPVSARSDDIEPVYFGQSERSKSVTIALEAIQSAGSCGDKVCVEDELYSRSCRLDCDNSANLTARLVNDVDNSTIMDAGTMVRFKIGAMEIEERAYDYRDSVGEYRGTARTSPNYITDGANYSITVTSQKYQTKTESGTIPTPSEGDAIRTMRLTPKPEYILFKVHVTSNIPTAELTLWCSPESADHRGTRVDTAGFHNCGLVSRSESYRISVCKTDACSDIGKSVSGTFPATGSQHIVEVSLSTLEPKTIPGSQSEILFTVRDAQGQPVPDVTVMFSKTGFTTVIQATNSRGSVLVQVPKNATYTIQAEKDGHESYSGTMNVTRESESRAVTMRKIIPQTTSVVFTLKNSQGQSVSGVNMVLSAEGTAPVSKTTDSTGKATFSLVVGKAYTIHATRDEYRPYTGTITPSATTTTRSITLTSATAPYTTVGVQVSNASTGTPLAGAGITYILGAGSQSGGMTNAQGNANTISLASGTKVTVRAVKDGFETATTPEYTVPTASPYIIAVNLTPLSSPPPSDQTTNVTLTVRNSQSQAVSGATITVSKTGSPSVTKTSNTSGTATFENLTIGAVYTVTIQAQGYSVYSGSMTVSSNSSPVFVIQSSGQGTPATVQLRAYVASSGAGLEASIVSFGFSNGNVSVTTGSNGYSEYIAANSNQTITVNTSRQGYQSASQTFSVTSSSQQTVNVNLVPVGQTPPSTIQLRVRVMESGANGSGLSNAAVTIIANGASTNAGFTDSSGYTGYLSFPVGQAVTITASKTDYSGSPLIYTTTSTAQQTVNLTLTPSQNQQPTAQMRVRVVANGGGLAGASVTISGGGANYWRETDASGYSSYVSFQVGQTVSITATKPGYSGSPISYTIASSPTQQTATVAMTSAPQNVQVRGRILDPSGAPLQYASVSFTYAQTPNQSPVSAGNSNFDGYSEYVFLNSNASVVMNVTRQGYSPVSQPFTLSSASQQTLTLTMGGSPTGGAFGIISLPPIQNQRTCIQFLGFNFCI